MPVTNARSARREEDGRALAGTQLRLHGRRRPRDSWQSRVQVLNALGRQLRARSLRLCSGSLYWRAAWRMRLLSLPGTRHARVAPGDNMGRAC